MASTRKQIIFARNVLMYVSMKNYVVDEVIDANKQVKVKLQRAHGECLGIRSR